MTLPLPFRRLLFSALALVTAASVGGQDLRPFTLPWDDAAATITDLSGLNTPIPLTTSWITPHAAELASTRSTDPALVGF